MDYVFIYSTAGTKSEAEKISKSLLRQKLIGCANLFPLTSMYHRKGKVVRGKEYALILKTIKTKVPVVKREIEKIHSYSIPGITEIAVKPNQKYASWLLKQCS